LIARRKLLVAADTPYYRKVIGLTFTDEGMEVTTVGDGQEAWESLEQSLPDAVLADVFLPGISGYELCGLIKENARFSRIPVMLLVGSFEPFDEAEARRVGADDVVTKPFQSIRQLVSRVGSLLSGKAPEEDSAAHEYSTLGLEPLDATTSAAPADDQSIPEKNVTVFVEAPLMTETDSSHSGEAAEIASPADLDLQTADTMRLDTMKLDRFDVEAPAQVSKAIAYAQDDTAEMEPAIKTENGVTSATGAAKMSEQPTHQARPSHSAPGFDDALLDLGDFDSATQRALADDVILDLDFEEPVRKPLGERQPVPESGVFAAAQAEIIAGAPSYENAPVAVVEPQEWAIVTQAPPVSVVEEEPSAGEPKLALSPAAIDAIAHRVVEQLSEKVVREIAWEVVPELAELLIKKKLEE
jgi:CheY-like chemotaxis protein